MDGQRGTLVVRCWMLDGCSLSLMKTLHLDIFSGISGDMFIGALLDLGVDAHQLEHELAKLELDGFHLHVSRQERGGIAGTKFDVHLSDHGQAHHHHHHDHGHGHEHKHGEDKHSHDHARNFSEIKQLITASKLSAWVKDKAVAVFHRIAVAEGKIHGHPPEQVHFHEVGAVDSIVDIVGACLALEMLGRPRVVASAAVEGTGTVKCAHGTFPLPAPATLEILGARGVALSQCEEPGELITPTGAAILAEFAESFGPLKNLAAQKIGYGLGGRQGRTRPNVLRAVLGVEEVHSAQCAVPSGAAVVAVAADVGGHDWESDVIAVLETNLDDINAEILGAFVESALAAGALDVFHTPIQMKKNRPGVLLTVLCAEGAADQFTEMMLRQTSAFGVRRAPAQRRKLRREIRRVGTPFGEVEVKLGFLDGALVQAAPEFESCRRLAAQAGVPLKQVYAAAVKAVEL